MSLPYYCRALAMPCSVKYFSGRTVQTIGYKLLSIYLLSPNRRSKCHLPQLLEPPCLCQSLPPLHCLLHPPCLPLRRHLPLTHLPLHPNPSLPVPHRPHTLGVLAPGPYASPSLTRSTPLVAASPSPPLSLSPPLLPWLLPVHSAVSLPKLEPQMPTLGASLSNQ